MRKTPKPCKYGRNPVTGRCYTLAEAEWARTQERWRERELKWAHEKGRLAIDLERRLERARKREILAGRVAGAISQVEQRQLEIRRRVLQAEFRHERRKEQQKSDQTAKSLLRQLDRIRGKSSAEIRERERLEESVRRTSEAIHQASEEAFYRKRPRAGLNGLHCIFGR